MPLTIGQAGSYPGKVNTGSNHKQEENLGLSETWTVQHETTATIWESLSGKSFRLLMPHFNISSLGIEMYNHLLSSRSLDLASRSRLPISHLLISPLDLTSRSHLLISPFNLTSWSHILISPLNLTSWSCLLILPPILPPDLAYPDLTFWYHLLISPIDLTSWSHLLTSSIDLTYWSHLLISPIDLTYWYHLLISPFDLTSWSHLLISPLNLAT